MDKVERDWIETDYSRGFGKLASFRIFQSFLFIRCIYVTTRVSPFTEQDQPCNLIGQCLHLIRTSQGAIYLVIDLCSVVFIIGNIR